MPIKSMRCICCGSSNCDFMVDFEDGSMVWVNKMGIVSFSEDEDIREGKSILGALKKNTAEYILGSCSGRCEDEASLVIIFDDGIKFEYDEEGAFKKLISELKNPTSTAKSSTIKISTGYLKTLIPQYVKEHFGNKALNTLTEEKNWKRISKSKNDGKILRIFEYKKNPEIKLYINSNESDTEIVGYNFQET